MAHSGRRLYRPPATAIDAPALASIMHAMYEAHRHSLAPGTRKNMDSQVRLYETFCGLAGLPAFPPTPVSIGAYAADYVLRGCKAHNLSGVVSRIKHFCLETGIPWLSPPGIFHVRKICRGLQRQFKEVTRRAAPFTMRVFERVLQVADPNDSLESTVITMCAVAHNGLLRGGELLALRVGDLTWPDSSRSSCSLRIQESKTNQFGPPEEIPYADFSCFSAVSFLRDYVSDLGIASRPRGWPLFPSRPHDPSCTTPMSRAIFVRVLRRLLARAGLDANAYTGHSFRSGGATDLYTGRCRVFTIQQQGRWTSDAIYIYIRDCPVTRRVEVARAFKAAAET